MIDLGAAVSGGNEMGEIDDLAREAALLNRPSGTVVCTCASIPPTMPTCRDKHLPSCPVAREEAWLAALVKAEKSLAFSRMNAQEQLGKYLGVSVRAEQAEARMDEMRKWLQDRRDFAGRAMNRHRGSDDYGRYLAAMIAFDDALHFIDSLIPA